MRSLPYALSRLSYGLSSGGIRTHHLWSRSISTLHHRQKLRMAGNGRCCSCPFGRLSYGISADGICTHVLRSRGALRSNKHLHHCHHAGEQAKPVFSDNNASSSCEEPEPATRRPSRGRLHGTCCQRRESNPLSPMVRSTRSLHHQRFRGNVRLRIGLSAVVSSDASAVFTTQMKLQNEFVAALSTMARRRSEPIWFALPSVDRDCSRRSLRQAPRFGARTFPHELPGSGSPVSAFAEITSERAMTRRTKTLRSLAREGPSTDLSIALMRDRSHVPGVRHRMADCHSVVCAGFHIRVACSTRVPSSRTISRRARLVRPADLQVNTLVSHDCGVWRGCDSGGRVKLRAVLRAHDVAVKDVEQSLQLLRAQRREAAEIGLRP